MCVNPTKSYFAVDRSSKLFIFMNNLFVKKLHSVWLFFFNYKLNAMSTFYKIPEGL